jgi:hypothetical protein
MLITALKKKAPGVLFIEEIILEKFSPKTTIQKPVIAIKGPKILASHRAFPIPSILTSEN